MTLFAILMQVVTLGSGHPVKHCRRAPYGCKARIQEFTKYFEEAGQAYQIPSKLLGAIASHESGLNPSAVSTIKAYSIMQLNPRRYWGPRVRKVPCRRLGACQRPAVMAGAKWYRLGIDICGDKRKALGWYSSGKCGVNGYARRVWRRYKKWQ